MKKYLNLLLAMIVVASMMFVSCKAAPAEAPAEATAETETTAAPAEETTSEESVAGAEEQTYYMVSFLSGIEWWIACANGMKDAAKWLGVKAEYIGTEKYDAMEQAQVFEQVVAMEPSGILVAPMNADAFIQPINNAIDKGIPVVTFGSDSPESKRPLFVSVDDYANGVRAALRIAEDKNKTGNVMVVTTIGQSNMMRKAQGFIDTIEKEYPNMKVVATVEEGGSYEITAKNVAEVIQAYPDLVGIWVCGSTGPGAVTAVEEAGKSDQIEVVTVDLDDALMKMIEDGKVPVTIETARWNLGFYGTLMLYLWANDIANPITNWKEAGLSPLPVSLDVGAYLVDKENVKYFKDVNVPK